MVAVPGETQLKGIPLPWDEIGYVSDIYVLDDSSILIKGSQNIVRYGSDGSVQATFPADYGDMAVFGSQLAVSDYTKKIILYDLDSADEVGQLNADSMGIRLGVADGSTLCYGNGSGIFRLNETADGWEQQVNVGMTSLCSPALSMEKMEMLADGGILVIFRNQDDSSCSAVRYDFSADAPATPSQRLHVFSLLGNDTSKQAAVVMQRENPELYVRIETVAKGSNVSDTLKSVNTALLAGKGADVFILDSMPIQAYMDKGVLLDMTDQIRQHTSTGEWMPNITESIQKDGRIYAFPTRFMVPSQWGDAEIASSIKNLGDLKAWAEANRDTPPFYSMDTMDIFRKLIPVCAPAWFSEPKVLDEAKMTEFLECVKTLSDIYPDARPADGDSLNFYGDRASWYVGKNKLIADKLNNVTILSELSGIVHDKGGAGPFALAGQAERVFIPKVITGINANSKQIELAKAFVETMLSAPVQKSLFWGMDGFPANFEALKNTIYATPEEKEEYMFGITIKNIKK